MRDHSKLMASAAIAGVALLCPPAVHAGADTPAPAPIGHVAPASTGTLHGVVRDEDGAPLAGAMVSAIGATATSAVTDGSGRFALRTLPAGSYLVRAHHRGFIVSRGQIIEVGPSARVASVIALRRAGAQTASAPVLTAGLGGVAPASGPEPEAAPPAADTADVLPGGDDHGETAWRLRHLRRGVLKNVTVPDAILADAPAPEANIFGPANLFGRAIGSPARAATDFFSGTPLSGQLNLMTTGSFDSPQQLFSGDGFSHNVAYVAVGAPIGDHADWAARGALTQGDITSWIAAGSYRWRAPARHQYDLGLSYSTQRYSGGNPAALRALVDGSRNVGEVYGLDTWTIAPALTMTYGGRWARYDYLDSRTLLSPRAAVTLAPSAHFRIEALLSRRALAPGAEEFVPPSDSGVWLPPQRTFSSLVPGRALTGEQTNHLQLQVERDLAGSTVWVRGFRQHVDDQLVTMFGVRIAGTPASDLGHYVVANGGQVNTEGYSAGLRTAIASHVHGSVEYTVSRARWKPGPDLDYLLLLAPSAARVRPERIHDVSTMVETEVPETATRVLVLYRASNGFAGRDAQGDRPTFDSRFDVQVRQSLPFMNFSTAQWEMLVGVRTFFRETAAEQSPFDELLVVRPPKRVVGGLTVKF